MQIPLILKGRKLAAFLLTSAFILVAGWTMVADKLSAISLALLGAYTAFVGGHSATDVAATKANAPATKDKPKDKEEGS